MVLLVTKKKSNNLEWVDPYFVQPKLRKTSTFQTLSEQLQHKPYLMPKINETLLKLKGLKFGTSLYLNIVYDHI